MGGGSPVNHIQYQNNSATDFGVNYGIDTAQPGFGTLRGYAYGANIGWINFEATGNPRVRFSDGSLEGYAYSANCGWINLGDPTQHNLKTDTIAPGIDTNVIGIPDAWQYLYFGGLGVDPNADPDGDGMTNLQEYLAGTNPLLATDQLRIITFATNNTGTSASLMWASTVARLYAIETRTDLITGSWTLDPNFGSGFAPDAGSMTTRALVETSGPKRFFRVRAIRPLSP